ncbi:hypothetical protein CK500_10465 [Halorubrum salipaludis]|uniref:Uncharacterized protein n=1 Tax=Halorubrum salipaludis TaxID=2032630 RepID=A0A2A2FEX1_9EURY|nr:hypothetical protein [Halorubrum salipaludis]PAU83217.1 hypothetical protein CK500_10465 [Halorubrum salipaludis]
MTPSLRRRRLLAAAVPGLLAGCLVESSGEAGGADDGTGDTDRESLSEGEESGAEQTDGEESDGADDDDEADGAETPEEVGPDGSGLVVTNVDVLDVTDGGYETTVEARLTVENAGRFTYGTVYFRVDAYATRPNSIEREAVGYASQRVEYSADDRFDGGDDPRRFTVEIDFRSRDTRARPDPDWYEVDAAVRRAEPV